MSNANTPNRDSGPASAGSVSKGKKVDPSLRGRIEGLVPEVVRRALLTGIGAIFLTEDGIRKAIADLPVPKDAVDTVLNRANHTKTQVLDLVGREVRAFLGKIDIGAEVERLLTSLTLEIKTDIRFIPNAERRVKPKIDTRVRVHRSEPSGSNAKVRSGSKDDSED